MKTFEEHGASSDLKQILGKAIIAARSRKPSYLEKPEDSKRFVVPNIDAFYDTNAIEIAKTDSEFLPLVGMPAHELYLKFFLFSVDYAYRKHAEYLGVEIVNGAKISNESLVAESKRQEANAKDDVFVSMTHVHQEVIADSKGVNGRWKEKVTTLGTSYRRTVDAHEGDMFVFRGIFHCVNIRSHSDSSNLAEKTTNRLTCKEILLGANKEFSYRNGLPRNVQEYLQTK